jgi:16S rRNA (uracil1498-N3)-methyltransferase
VNNLFYIPDISGNTVTLDSSESKHAIKVLRMNEGSQLQIVDGKGGFYTAEITNANPAKCRLSILHTRKESGKKKFRLHIAIAPTKNIVRFEWFLEKATEIGIDEITPVISKHSERKVIKPVRLEKILISAMKQSQKATLPELNKLTSFNECLDQNIQKEKFIAHCRNGEKPHLKKVVKNGTDVLILIGPEGDFSPEEIERAVSMGLTEISLGDARLRTETAGVAACLIVNLANE